MPYYTQHELPSRIAANGYGYTTGEGQVEQMTGNDISCLCARQEREQEVGEHDQHPGEDDDCRPQMCDRRVTNIFQIHLKYLPRQQQMGWNHTAAG